MTHHPFKVVIPARYASTRLPGKPLREIAGKTMVQHVYERALESGAEEVVIATDDLRIQQAVEGFGAPVCMTSPDHPSGTDRLREAVEILGWHQDDIVVNVQGDEPMIPSAVIRQVGEDLAAHPQAAIATLSQRIEHVADLFDPNVVKVVSDTRGFAIYFSRAPIPWNRDAFGDELSEIPTGQTYFRHIGLYAYRAEFLKKYVDWGHCALEECESLEQLRALWHGAQIHVAEAVEPLGHGVDTEADLERVAALLKG